MPSPRPPLPSHLPPPKNIWGILCKRVYKTIRQRVQNLLHGRGYRILCGVFLLFVGLVYVHYLLQTPFNQRAHDVGGHLEYIDFLLKNHRIPNYTEGWTAYHPPLYFLICAGLKIQLLSLHLNPEEINFVFQILSLLLMAVYLFYGVKTILSYLTHLKKTTHWESQSLTLGGLSLFLLFPSHIIHSARIGNDLLYYALFSFSFYHFSAWYLGRYKFLPTQSGSFNSPDLWLSCGGALLALITKSNALILVGLIGGLGGYLWILEHHQILKQFPDHLRAQEPPKPHSPAHSDPDPLTLSPPSSPPPPHHHHHHRYSLFPLPSPLLVLTFASLLIFLPKGLRYLRGETANPIVENAGGLHNSLAGDQNRLKNYLILDLTTFVKEPYNDPFSDRSSRMYFWNFFLKSSLLGEFQFPQKTNWEPWLARSLSFLWLLLLPFLWVGGLRWGRDPAYAPLTLLLILSPLASMALRFLVPEPCSSDFRYVLPMNISTVFFLMTSSWKWGPLFKRGISLLFFLFLLCSGLFILNL